MHYSILRRYIHEHDARLFFGTYSAPITFLHIMEINVLSYTLYMLYTFLVHTVMYIIHATLLLICSYDAILVRHH